MLTWLWYGSFGKIAWGDVVAGGNAVIWIREAVGMSLDGMGT